MARRVKSYRQIVQENLKRTEENLERLRIQFGEDSERYKICLSYMNKTKKFLKKRIPRRVDNSVNLPNSVVKYIYDQTE